MIATRPTLSLNERDRRWESVRNLLRANKLDCLIVVGLSGTWRFDTYLAGEHADGIVVFPLVREPTYLTWTPTYISRHTENRARYGVGWIDNWQIGTNGKGLSQTLLSQGLKKASIGVVGLGGHGSPIEADGWIPYGTWVEVLKQLPDANFVDLTSPFIELMLVKSAEELELSRYASQVGELACEAMLKAVQDGKNENEIFAAMTSVIYTHGCDPTPGPFIHSGVENLSWAFSIWLSQAQAPRTVSRGDIAQTEIFVNYGGIQSQQQMSIALGPVAPVCLELADTARRSYEAGLKVMYPGRTWQELADAMEVPLEETKCWHSTPLVHSLSPNHLVGHLRVGMERMPGYQESHRVTPIKPYGGERVLVPGMVIEMEPNACIGNWRVNIGGAIIITEDGPEELNRLPTRMQIVE